jgi:hypothetical protein
MRMVLYLLIAFAYLAQVLSIVSLKKSHKIANGLIAATLAFVGFAPATQMQIVFCVCWSAFVFLFNLCDFLSFYISDGKIRIHESKAIYWYLYVPLNAVLVAVRLWLHFRESL